MRWTVYGTYGTLRLIGVLMVLSPAFSGTPVALFPEWDFDVFPFRTPGIVTIPAGFLLGTPGRGRRPGPDTAPGEPHHHRARQAPVRARDGA
ncbi:hypothetical protein [Streptomyces sp. NPDC048565]|uniref:hypothetical protein n=1 Tax=Streptomyces sp. NPDC048565 TaxID=3155266 RepID=UPI0034487B18